MAAGPSSLMNAMNAQKEHYLTFRVRAFKDAKAFDQIYQMYGKPVARFLAAKLPKGEVDDAQATTFLRLWSYLLTSPSVEHLGGLVFTIARTVTAEFYRKRAAAPVDAVDPDVMSDTIEDVSAGGQMEAEADVALLSQTIRTMDEEQQTVIILRHVHGYSIGDIAKKMERTEGSVRMLLHRALKEVRERMEPHEQLGIHNPPSEDEERA